jgi:hypothetical protein
MWLAEIRWGYWVQLLTDKTAITTASATIVVIYSCITTIVAQINCNNYVYRYNWTQAASTPIIASYQGYLVQATGCSYCLRTWWISLLRSATLYQLVWFTKVKNLIQRPRTMKNNLVRHFILFDAIRLKNWCEQNWRSLLK